jgi:IclR family KDG regulon transcriptional repressor
VSNQIIKSFSRGLNVLKEIISYGKPITANELCARLDIDKSTMSRIISTLVYDGFIRYLDESKELIATSVLEDTQKKTKIELVVKKTKALLEDIYFHTGECSYVGIFDNYSLLYLNQVDNSNRVLRTRNSIGLHAPLHTNALGKAILAYGNFDLEKVKLNEYTNNTITSIEKLKSTLDEVRQNGYSIDDEEYELGLRCVATPLFNKEGILIGAVGISGAASRLSHEKLNEYGKKIFHLARKYILIC